MSDIETENEEQNFTEAVIHEKNTTVQTIAIAIFALVALAASGFYYFSESQKENDPVHVQERLVEDKRYQELFSLREESSFDKEITLASELLEDDSFGSDDKLSLTMRIASAHFAKGDEDSKTVGINMIKEMIADEETSDRRKAFGINWLIGFYYHSRDPIVFDQIFNDGPLAFLHSDGETHGSTMKRVSGYSYSLHPTSYALLRESIWYSGELLDNETMSLDSRVELEKQLFELLDEAEKINKREENYRASLPDQDDIRVQSTSYYHFRAFHLASIVWSQVFFPDDGSVERVAIHPKSFEDNWNVVFDLQKNNPNDNDLARFSTWGYFYHSAFLYEIYGESRFEDIQSNLDTLQTIVSNDSDLIRSTGVMYLLHIEGIKKPEERDHTYRFAIEMADFSDDFLSMLKFAGWDEVESLEDYKSSN